MYTTHKTAYQDLSDITICTYPRVLQALEYHVYGGNAWRDESLANEHNFTKLKTIQTSGLILNSYPTPAQRYAIS